MSNVFKYPDDNFTGYISGEDSTLLGMIERAQTYLDSDTTKPYGASYLGGTSPFAGLAGYDNYTTGGSPATRSPENALELISKFRAYYGVASSYGVGGYPSYEAIYKQPAIEAYFHIIQFRFTSAYAHTDGSLRLECRRDTSSHTTLGLPSFSATDTHGLGDGTTQYSTTYSLEFKLNTFDTSVATEWGNYLNFDDNGGTKFYLKVIGDSTVEVYTDSAYTTPVNIGASGLNWSSYTSGGFAVITEVNGSATYLNQLLHVTAIDQGNTAFTYYVSDYYSGYGNSVNTDFGANVVGARASFYVKPTDSMSSFDSNTVIDYLSVTDWQINSNFNPVVTITTSGQGSVYTGSGNNGCVTGATITPAFGGLMAVGANAGEPFGVGSRCLILPTTLDSDTVNGYDFSVSGITNASPAVVTFTNGIVDQSGAQKVFTGISGLVDSSGVTTKDLNGVSVYLKQTSRNVAELYHDSAFTSPVDTSAWSAYSSGGRLHDFDNDIFAQVSTFGGDYTGRTITGESPTLKNYTNFAPMPLETNTAGAGDQVWPTVTEPAKMNITLIHPTRKSYGQDLTRYTNSTGAYGYRLSLTYNNISKANWRVYHNFIQQMRGASAAFTFNYSGGYQIFDTATQTINVWNIGAKPRLAKAASYGDAAVYMTGFQAGLEPGAYDRQIVQAGDVFFNLGSYRRGYSLNNVSYAGGDFETNQFGEAIIRFTSPATTELANLSGSITPTDNYTYFQCMLSDDEVEYDWHPTGNFVSFKLDMDVV